MVSLNCVIKDNYEPKKCIECTYTQLKDTSFLINYLKNNYKKNIFLVIISIDNFKEINSYFGYETSSSLLVEISNRLNKIKFNTQEIIKLNNNEFAIYEDNQNITNIDYFIKKIKSQISMVFNDTFGKELCLDIRYKLGISYGKGVNILNKSNEALNIAKTENKNLHFCGEKYEVNLNKNYFEIIKDIKNALVTNAFCVYYQPIINNNDEKIYKFEALVRINKNNILIMPTFFLDISIKTRLYNHISRFVIEKVFQDLKEKDFCVSINLSINDIKNFKTRKLIIKLLSLNNCGDRITFEILESINIYDYKAINSFIKEVKKYGCKISLDDFGSGFSNFNYLINIDFDYLKIDGQFIKEIFNKKNQSAIKSILLYCKENGIKTVAEYVSSYEIYLEVKKLGIDYSQGYYFGKAEPFSKIKPILSDIRLKLQI